MPARKLRKDWHPSQDSADFHHFVWAMLWGVFLVALAFLIPVSCAHSQPIHEQLTFEDGYRKTWAEMHGPTFALTLSNSEVDVVRRALDKVAEEHDKNHDGFDDYWMGRRQRVLEEMDQGGFGLFVGGPGGWEDRQEKTFPLTLLEITLIGIAVSRDRYCRAEDQDVGELDFLTAGVECYIRNSEAVAFFGRLEKAQHMTPGGANGK